ncbi:MAG TPA: hypothetical protein VHA70_13220 [Bauldia sp.]|nr:hypothetical protein [Bauldia sp.]
MSGPRRLLCAFLLAGVLLCTSFAWPPQISINSTAAGAGFRAAASGNQPGSYPTGFHRLVIGRDGRPRDDGAAAGFWAFGAPSAALDPDMVPTIGRGSGTIPAAGSVPDVTLSLR